MKPTNIRLMLSRFAAVALLTSFLVSCDKEDSEQPAPPPPVNVKLKEFRNDEDFVRFSYAADGKINKATVKSALNTSNGVVEYAITYQGQQLASLQGDNGETIVTVYENNKLKRADIFVGQDRVGYSNYFFENDLLKSVTIYTATDSDFEPILEFSFAYNAAGNVSETVVMSASGIPNLLTRAGHTTYEYDQKTNPLLAYNDILLLFWQVASKNNITLENHFDSNLQPEDRYAYTYTYKANGLPEKAVVKIGLPGQPGTTANIEYIYQ